MKIFITGNLGYVGAWLAQYLRVKHPNAFIAGYDTGYFQQCLTTTSFAPERVLDVQYYGDVRNFDENILKGYDSVIHLAAISNDPIGNKFEQVTLDVNYESSIDIARKAIRQGVRSFVFASSCSVYGAAGDGAKIETSELNPLTAYAKSKVKTEEGLSKLDAGNTVITCLRFATACGISDRLRLDLVLNDFVASAITLKKINILSDGTPWRPLINVKDMARAINWAINRDTGNGGKFLICNTGSNSWNYTVKELAQHVQKHFTDIEVSVNQAAPPDKRSYRVNFDLFTSLATGYTPKFDINTTIEELKSGLASIQFNNSDFRNSSLMRLNVLNTFLNKHQLDLNLNWK
jgi:nucleoside-diphosphate-sugar epimerase